MLDIGVWPGDAKAMAVADEIRRKLSESFTPVTLVVTDESSRHAGHAGARPEGESHFHVRIVSEKFSGLTRVERQRRIYAALEAEFRAGLHALSLKAETPSEAGRD